MVGGVFRRFSCFIGGFLRFMHGDIDPLLHVFDRLLHFGGTVVKVGDGGGSGGSG